jgi:methylated-DNA-[protein]-cysteine S-methyltransferase
MDMRKITNHTPTLFQKRVYKALLKIPRGQITTYKILARHLGCRSCRAVGQALKRNPFAPQVPCHRVIASDLTPGGFSALGETSSKDGQGKTIGMVIRQKLKLLEKEGVKFKRGRLSDPGRIYRFD